MKKLFFGSGVFVFFIIFSGPVLAGAVKPGSIGTTELKDAAVTFSKIAGGAAGANQVLTTDGAGNLSWTTPLSSTSITADSAGHLVMPMAFASCSGPFATTLSHAGTDQIGRIILNPGVTAANCTVTFSQPYDNIPDCVVIGKNLGSIPVTPSATKVQFTWSGPSEDDMTYVCTAVP